MIKTRTSLRLNEMRYIIAFAIGALLSLGIFALPWIVTRFIPPPGSREDEVELSQPAEILVAVADLVYSCRWILAVFIFLGCIIAASLLGSATQP